MNEKEKGGMQLLSFREKSTTKPNVNGLLSEENSCLLLHSNLLFNIQNSSSFYFIIVYLLYNKVDGMKITLSNENEFICCSFFIILAHKYIMLIFYSLISMSTVHPHIHIQNIDLIIIVVRIIE